MRSLSSTLLAAQRSASASPYLRVELSDYFGDVWRLRWTRYYEGAEGDLAAAAAVAADGSLVRARIESGTPAELYVSRVAAPDAESDYSSWTLLDDCETGGVALIASSSEVILFYVDTDGETVLYRVSGDNGASWGAAQTLLDAGATVSRLAAAFNTDGDDWLLLWQESGVVHSWRQSLDAEDTWSNTADSVLGIAVTYQGDWNVVVTGTTTDGERWVWAAIYGDGLSQAADTWSALKVIHQASDDTDLSFRRPALGFYGGAWRCFFIESFSGDGAYARVYWTTLELTSDFNEELWREPVPFDLEGVTGALALAVENSQVWLVTAAGVWHAPGVGAALDVTADVLEADATGEGEDGRLTLVLRNDDGRYAADAGTLVRRGARVQLSPGYYTTAGAEASAGPTYWIEELEYRTGERGELVVRARDAWSFLERWRSRRSYQFAAGAKNVFNLLDLVFHRAGLNYTTLSASGALTNFFPAFTIHPGESGRTAVRRLLAMVPDRLRMRGSLAAGLDPQDDDSSDYAYGVDHVILAGRYVDRGPTVNRALAFGTGAPPALGEAFDFADIEAVGEKFVEVVDLNLADDPDDCADRAAALVRVAALAARRDEIEVLVNAGQEVWDVVEVTDAQAGLDAAPRRVLGWRLRYQPGRGVYEQTLTLGEP
jgi:hypothetical protein